MSKRLRSARRKRNYRGVDLVGYDASKRSQDVISYVMKEIKSRKRIRTFYLTVHPRCRGRLRKNQWHISGRETITKDLKSWAISNLPAKSILLD